ncbi:MAG: hypothetical protein WCE53_03195 [Candidatus Acidiferrum sp.]
MALISGLALFVGTVLVATLSKLAVEEIVAWSPSIIRTLIKFAVGRLPENLRARFDEEWQSHVNDVPGQIGKLLVAMGFLFAACDLASNDRRAKTVEKWGFLRIQYEEALSVAQRILGLTQNSASFKTLLALKTAGSDGRFRELFEKEDIAASIDEVLHNVDTGQKRLKSLIGRNQRMRNRIARRVAIATAIPDTFVGNLLSRLVDPVQLGEVCDRVKELVKSMSESEREMAEAMEKAAKSQSVVQKMIEEETTRTSSH